MNKMVCEYCGKEKDEVGFFIGACIEPDWVMVEGTGKIACPDCHGVATREGQEAIDRHCRAMGYRKEATCQSQ